MIQKKFMDESSVTSMVQGFLSTLSTKDKKKKKPTLKEMAFWQGILDEALSPKQKEFLRRGLQPPAAKSKPYEFSTDVQAKALSDAAKKRAAMMNRPARFNPEEEPEFGAPEKPGISAPSEELASTEKGLAGEIGASGVDYSEEAADRGDYSNDDLELVPDVDKKGEATALAKSVKAVRRHMSKAEVLERVMAEIKALPESEYRRLMAARKSKDKKVKQRWFDYVEAKQKEISERFGVTDARGKRGTSRSRGIPYDFEDGDGNISKLGSNQMPKQKKFLQNLTLQTFAGKYDEFKEFFGKTLIALGKAKQDNSPKEISIAINDAIDAATDKIPSPFWKTLLGSYPNELQDKIYEIADASSIPLTNADRKEKDPNKVKIGKEHRSGTKQSDREGTLLVSLMGDDRFFPVLVEFLRYFQKNTAEVLRAQKESAPELDWSITGNPDTTTSTSKLLGSSGEASFVSPAEAQKLAKEEELDDNTLLMLARRAIDPKYTATKGGSSSGLINKIIQNVSMLKKVSEEDVRDALDKILIRGSGGSVSGVAKPAAIDALPPEYPHKELAHYLARNVDPKELAKNPRFQEFVKNEIEKIAPTLPHPQQGQESEVRQGTARVPTKIAPNAQIPGGLAALRNLRNSEFKQKRRARRAAEAERKKLSARLSPEAEKARRADIEKKRDEDITRRYNTKTAMSDKALDWQKSAKEKRDMIYAEAQPMIDELEKKINSDPEVAVWKDIVRAGPGKSREARIAASQLKDAKDALNANEQFQKIRSNYLFAKKSKNKLEAIRAEGQMNAFPEYEKFIEARAAVKETDKKYNEAKKNLEAAYKDLASLHRELKDALARASTAPRLKDEEGRDVGPEGQMEYGPDPVGKLSLGGKHSEYSRGFKPVSPEPKEEVSGLKDKLKAAEMASVEKERKRGGGIHPSHSPIDRPGRKVGEQLTDAEKEEAEKSSKYSGKTADFIDDQEKRIESSRAKEDAMNKQPKKEPPSEKVALARELVDAFKKKMKFFGEETPKELFQQIKRAIENGEIGSKFDSVKDIFTSGKAQDIMYPKKKKAPVSESLYEMILGRSGKQEKTEFKKGNFDDIKKAKPKKKYKLDLTLKEIFEGRSQ